jgi:hypothetical protein
VSSSATPNQIVGTPAASVTRSRCIRSTRLAGSWSRPHITILAPTITPACARPHALAWNIGTTGSTASLGPRPTEAAEVATIECRNVERWL